MDLEHLKSEAEKVFSSEELNPVEKMRAIDQIVKPNLTVKGPIANRDNDDVADAKKPYGNDAEKSAMLTGFANTLREMVRESAWGGPEPISLKEALGNSEMFDEDTWDLIESWIDHDRDYKWNYLNLIQFNLKNNRKEDDSGFWLSPQHFRMAAIIDTVSRELDENNSVGFDLDLAKSLYRNENQIPQAISESVKELRHAS